VSAAVWTRFSPLPNLNLCAVASEQGLCRVSINGFDECDGRREDTHPLLRESCRQLSEYFERRRERFDVPLDLRGTAFQKSVWQTLLEIPYGETRSYKDIAQQLGSAGAVRAVGAANGRNPIAIIVPCHRVVAANGSLQGYAAGLSVKRLLLNLEAGHLPSPDLLSSRS
jgi:methylated-DNA-[protein]-cysteine S-methyltransferase